MSFTLQQNNIVIDLSLHRSVTVHMSQYDLNSRPINITVTDNRKPYPISQTATVRYQVHKPDGTFIDDLNNVTINADGTVTIIPSEQFTSTPGTLDAQIKIYEDGKIISPLCFNIIVEKSPIDNDEVMSMVTINVIDELLSKLKIVDECAKHLVNYDNPHTVTMNQVGVFTISDEDINEMFNECFNINNEGGGEIE